MNFLFKIGYIEFDIEMLFSFIFGLFIGALLICLIYALIVVASLGSKKFLVKTEDDTLTQEEVKEMIIIAQNTFKDKNLRGDLSRVNHCKNISTDLVYAIATRFYPNSKYPLLEISVDEAILLVGYIQKRIDDILDKRGIRLLKKLKISSIVNLTQKTNQVVDSKLFQVGLDIGGAVSTIKKIVNVVNPAWWFRKVFVDKSMNIILNKLCVIIIAVVGEETYKIYSKKVFNQDVEIESNIDQLVSSLDNELIEAKKQAREDEYIVIDQDLSSIQFKKKIYIQEKYDMKYDSIYDSSEKLKNKDIIIVDDVKDKGRK
ncbi:MAG: hypothetical protein IJA65_02735 [Acholeplasmatales bacterium]|nr:hypothetical protein [Acholeplasmatales bacterium]